MATVWADVPRQWLPASLGCSPELVPLLTRINRVIDEAFLHWRGLRKPCRPMPSFTMDGKANNLSRFLTQAKAGVETVVNF